VLPHPYAACRACSKSPRAGIEPACQFHHWLVRVTGAHSLPVFHLATPDPSGPPRRRGAAICARSGLLVLHRLRNAAFRFGCRGIAPLPLGITSFRCRSRPGNLYFEDMVVTVHSPTATLPWPVKSVRQTRTVPRF
jgi:hypothetical protein